MSDSVGNWLQPALSVILGDRGSCDIRFSLQGEYVSDELAAELRQTGHRRHRGHHQRQRAQRTEEVTEAEFIDVSDAALAGIRNRFTRYLEDPDRGLLPRGATDLFILDIEGVVSPARIGGMVDPDPQNPDRRRNAVIDGYKARIRGREMSCSRKTRPT